MLYNIKVGCKGYSLHGHVCMMIAAGEKGSYFHRRCFLIAETQKGSVLAGENGDQEGAILDRRDLKTQALSILLDMYWCRAKDNSYILQKYHKTAFKLGKRAFLDR